MLTKVTRYTVHVLSCDIHIWADPILNLLHHFVNKINKHFHGDLVNQFNDNYIPLTILAKGP